MISGMPTGGQPLPQGGERQDTIDQSARPEPTIEDATGLQDDLDGDGHSTTTTSWATRLFGSRLPAKFAFVLSRFPLGLFWFTMIVAGLPLGIGTLIVWIGVLILGGLFHLLRGGARLERMLVELVGGPQIQSPYRTPPDGARLVRRWRTRLGDPATYRDLLYIFMQFPLGLISFVVITVTLAVPIGALAAPLFYNRMGSGRIMFFGGGDNPALVIDRLWKALLLSFVGLILVPLIPLVTRGLSALHVRFATLLLGPTRRAEIAKAHEQRDLGLSADMTERKRIERDLHDGAQQRLVAMTMELGRARAKLDDDPDSAKDLLDSAHGHAKAAMQELRDLARGISPPLLSDRGLDAALSALAARSPIPIDLTVKLNRRLPESVESTAYFVIAESMTNAIKHSKAKVITVRVVDHTSRLSVSISDNGLGGVDPSGSGVMGLADRVRSVGGDFMARNRDGGAAGGGFAGVEILAEIPCGS